MHQVYKHKGSYPSHNGLWDNTLSEFSIDTRKESRCNNKWLLYVLRYHEIMVIYPYPFFVANNPFLSCTIFINASRCILTGSPG